MTAVNQRPLGSNGPGGHYYSPKGYKHLQLAN